VNGPLVVEDRIVTGPGSRAELQFDWANMLRISHSGEVRLAELENQRFMVQIARGTVTWRVLRDQDAYVEISTPSVSVRPVKKGVYRVTVLEDGSSEITVRSGEAEIFTPKGSERLRGGRTMFARGSTSDPEFRTGGDIPDDDWDRWNERRDRDLLRTQSYNYISRDIYGADDLDANGRWVNTGVDGWCWAPRVAASWAPYRYGRWAWVDWYGWTWVSSDSWGWAPYHYGRWYNHASHGWLWHPGAISARHRWAPAYVAFFGFGGGANVGFGWGRVGWIPLAPYERFNPWWGNRYYSGYRNRTYIDNSVTVVNNVNITNVYRNARVNNGYTVIDGDGFRQGRAGQAGRFSDSEWRQASVAQGPVPVTPGRESLRMADREAAVRGSESRTGSDRFFSARKPATVDRVSFDDQRRGVEQIARRAYDSGGAGSGAGGASQPVRGEASGNSSANGGGWRSPETGSRQSSGAPTSGATGRSERSDEANRGWRSAGESPTRGTGTATPVPAVNSEAGGGWQRFGSARGSGGSPAAAERGTSPSGRFGEPAAPAAVDSGAGAARGSAAGGSGRTSSDGWTRFGDRGSQAGSSPDASSTRGSSGGGRSSEGRTGVESRSPEARSSGSESRSERFSGGRGSGSSPSMAPERGSGGRGSSSGESIRISPPIVRERSAPSVSAPPSSRGSDGGGRSAPSAAPSRGSDGGGGGGRGSEGGGSRGSGERSGGRGR
ncbi:MAG: DUF6600 domain-containing protein, partial [Bryobacteraceae bacterium]|nr:DUF6600 domain-containing protein [Bryobacteraceae bacterium]